jgi:hypothetical protein
MSIETRPAIGQRRPWISTVPFPERPRDAVGVARGHEADGRVTSADEGPAVPDPRPRGHPFHLIDGGEKRHDVSKRIKQGETGHGSVKSKARPDMGDPEEILLRK